MHLSWLNRHNILGNIAEIAAFGSGMLESLTYLSPNVVSIFGYSVGSVSVDPAS